MVIDRQRKCTLNPFFKLFRLALIKGFITPLKSKFEGFLCWVFIVYDVFIDILLLYSML